MDLACSCNPITTQIKCQFFLFSFRLLYFLFLYMEIRSLSASIHTSQSKIVSVGIFELTLYAITLPLNCVLSLKQATTSESEK